MLNVKRAISRNSCVLTSSSDEIEAAVKRLHLCDNRSVSSTKNDQENGLGIIQDDEIEQSCEERDTLSKDCFDVLFAITLDGSDDLVSIELCQR